MTSELILALLNLVLLIDTIFLVRSRRKLEKRIRDQEREIAMWKEAADNTQHFKFEQKLKPDDNLIITYKGTLGKTDIEIK